MLKSAVPVVYRAQDGYSTAKPYCASHGGPFGFDHAQMCLSNNLKFFWLRNGTI